MKTLNKEEKKAVAADIFKCYPNAQKVAVTSDGMAFITDESENAVLNHSKNNRHGKELEVERFTRDQAAGSKEHGAVKTGEDKGVKDGKDSKGGKKAEGKPDGSTGSPTKGKPKAGEGKKDETPKTEA